MINSSQHVWEATCQRTAEHHACIQRMVWSCLLDTHSSITTDLKAARLGRWTSHESQHRRSAVNITQSFTVALKETSCGHAKKIATSVTGTRACFVSAACCHELKT